SVPTPAEARHVFQAAEIRTGALPPGRVACNSRNPTRPGSQTADWQLQSGTRQSVFSFVLAQPALGLHSRERLIEQLLRADGNQRLRRRGYAIQFQPVNFLKSPEDVEPVDLCPKQARLHLIPRIASGFEKFQPRCKVPH